MKKILAIIAVLLLAVSAFGQTKEELQQQLKETTAALNAITDDYIELVNEYAALTEQLQETTNALKETTNTLEEMRVQVQEDQEEIELLRQTLETTLIPAYTDSMFSVGVGYTQPPGLEVIFNIDIPNFFLGFYGRFNYQFDVSTNMAAGIKIDL